MDSARGRHGFDGGVEPLGCVPRTPSFLVKPFGNQI